MDYDVILNLSATVRALMWLETHGWEVSQYTLHKEECQRRDEPIKCYDIVQFAKKQGMKVLIDPPVNVTTISRHDCLITAWEERGAWCWRAYDWTQDKVVGKSVKASDSCHSALQAGVDFVDQCQEAKVRTS